MCTQGAIISYLSYMHQNNFLSGTKISQGKSKIGGYTISEPKLCLYMNISNVFRPFEDLDLEASVETAYKKYNRLMKSHISCEI